MTGWKTSEKPGYLEKTMQRGNCEITVYRPELTPAEKERREQHVRDALVHSTKDYLTRKAEKSNERD